MEKTLFFVDNLLPEQDPFWRLFLETPHKETNADIALTLSTELNISTTIDEESLKANADTVKNQGLETKDHRALSSAASQYHSIQMLEEEYYCRGRLSSNWIYSQKKNISCNLKKYVASICRVPYIIVHFSHPVK